VDIDDEDDEFMETYRRKRLTELKSTNTKTVFGNVVDVDGDLFLKMVTPCLRTSACI
jgi:hypothetical protein